MRIPQYSWSDPDQLANVDNTIDGSGYISGTLTNAASGVIDANVCGQTLSVASGDSLTNAGLLEATNGGTL